MGVGEGVVAVSAACECMCGTHGSGGLSSADNVLGMHVGREVGGVGGVCEMCMCLAQCGVEGVESEWVI